MRWQSTGFRILSLVAFGMLALATTSVLAQDDGGNDGGNDNDQQDQGGIYVDADGVLRARRVDLSGQVMRQYRDAALAHLPRDAARSSRLRKISLPRLEKAIIDANGAVTDEMRYLAGLTRIKYVFVYPESGDIVIAGPAEGWMTDPADRVIGIDSGRPIVQLQDLVVAMRTYPPDRNNSPLIACSIDPTQEGLARMQDFLRRVGHRATPSQTGAIVRGLRESLGYQDISVDGVPAKTRFAQIMVEADYMMKLIGIGEVKPPVPIRTFIDVASSTSISRKALFRWYFVPDYECVRVSQDGYGMEMVGNGVKLVAADEIVGAGGQRSGSGSTNRASAVWVHSFTENYQRLAQRAPVFAELRNLIDCAVAAAFMQREGYYTKAEWKMPFFGQESKFAVETHNAPERVISAVGHVWEGNRLMTPIGGGVHIEADMALDVNNLLDDVDGKVAQERQSVGLDLPEGRWWWD